MFSVQEMLLFLNCKDIKTSSDHPKDPGKILCHVDIYRVSTL